MIHFLIGAVVIVVVLILLALSRFPSTHSSNGMLLTMFFLLGMDSWFIGGFLEWNRPFDCIFLAVGVVISVVTVYCCIENSILTVAFSLSVGILYYYSLFLYSIHLIAVG
jgi:hypothetical protein